MSEARVPCPPCPGESPITAERCAVKQEAFWRDRPGSARTCMRACHYYCQPATKGDIRLTTSIVADAAKDRAQHRREVIQADRNPRVSHRDEQVFR